MDYDLIVVGSGISGATVAYIAGHDYHQRVLVLEKEKHVAGLAFDERDERTGILVQRYGCHFIHTDNTYVYQFLKRITDFYPFQLTAETVIDGKRISIPFHYGAIDSLYAPKDAARLKSLIADEYRYEHYVPLMDMLRSEKREISAFAKRLMKEHFIPLEAARRGISEEKLDGRVLQGNYFQLGYSDGCYAERYQMLPEGGFTALIEKMLSDPHITLKMGINALDHIQIKKDRVTEENILYFDEQEVEIPVVYTGGLDELFNYRYGALPYYRMNVEYTVEDVRSLSSPNINIPRDRKGFSKTDFSYFDCTYSGGKTVVSREYESKAGFQTSPKPSKKKRNQYQKYRKLADKTKNLYLCGRLAEYRFISIADSIGMAMSMIEQLSFKYIDLTPEYVAYRPTMDEVMGEVNCFSKHSNIKSDLIIGDLCRPIPKITVVIPTFNRLESLKETLNSVLKQDIPQNQFDILIVDNDPSPNNATQKYLEAAAPPNLYYYRNRKNIGAYGNQNRCFELVRSEWASTVHDDDILFPNALRWALHSIDAIHDPKTALIIPKQVPVYSKNEMNVRKHEKGLLQEKAVVRVEKSAKLRWRIYEYFKQCTRRRFWKVTPFDCFMIPFLYPAPTYGTVTNVKAFLDSGGFLEGYPISDNFLFVKMSKKYHIYLCGEAWGLYSFYTADAMKPRSALQFVDAVVQYRLYMEEHSIQCKIAGKLIREGSYLDAVEGDFFWGKQRRGYNTAKENYQYYTQYRASERRKKWCRRIQKCWDFWVLARAALFGKRIHFGMVERCNGEHI